MNREKNNDSTKIGEKRNNIVKLKAKDELKVSVDASVTLRMLSKFSDKHFRNACLCTKSSISLENTYSDKDDEKTTSEKFHNDIAYATGAIVSIVAYLETTINEFFSDCITKAGNYDNFSKIDENSKNELVSYWNKTNQDGKFINRYKDTLERYRSAYKIIKGKDSHYPSRGYYENAKNLINLRNILVHYEPKWQCTDPIYDDPYGVNILDGKFPYNKFREKSGNSFFPSKCLGAGCAKWAIINSEEFVKEFFSNIDVVPQFFKVWEIREEILR